MKQAHKLFSQTESQKKTPMQNNKHSLEWFHKNNITPSNSNNKLLYIGLQCWSVCVLLWNLYFGMDEAMPFCFGLCLAKYKSINKPVSFELLSTLYVTAP